jgi:hypothetical protein
MAELPNSFHTHQSWGRTRSPKNILSPHRKGTDGTSGLVVAAGATSALFNTENQRFLFVEISAEGNGSEVVTVKGKMHAGSGTAQLIPGQPTMDAIGLYKIDLLGIDQVSFTCTGGTSVTIFAACSTF